MTRIQDSFTRPNANLVGITSDAWSWIKDGGNDNSIRVYANQLARFADQTTATQHPSPAFSSNDQFIEFQAVGGFVVGTANTNFSIRINSDPATSTYYSVVYTPTTGSVSGKIVINKVGTGTVTPVSTNIPQGPAEYFNLRVVSSRSGTSQTIAVSINGTQISQMVDATGTPNSGKYVGISSYANSARKDSAGYAWYADSMQAGDLKVFSRYNMSYYDGAAEQAAGLEMVKSGTVSYPSSYIDYVVGENDAKYPAGYNAGYYNS